MKILLWLDDLRNPHSHTWDYFISTNFEGMQVVWVLDYEEFVNYLENNPLPDCISFDHDLGLGKTGYDCAKYLVDYCMDKNIDIPRYKVHSKNPIGVQNIRCLMDNYHNFFINQTK